MNKKHIPYGIIGLLVFIILTMLAYVYIFHIKMMWEIYTGSYKTTTHQGDIPFKWYSQSIANHCVMMADMAWCEAYNEYRESQRKMGMSHKSMMNAKIQDDISFMNIDLDTLPDATKIEVVELKDGDTYTMEVTQVAKDIWNDAVVMLAYNGSIPGPILTAPEWSKVTLKFVNKVEWLETTLHSHGLRWDYTMDWVPKDMMGTQDPVEFWESFSYSLEFPDTGVFWYHPHIREDLQQELGLYGNFIITPNDDHYWWEVNSEQTLILDDILIENGKIAPISSEFANYILMGRFGNTMLINGETDYTITAKAWEIQRLNLTNVSNTRVYNFEIPWVKMKRVWGDIWKYEQEEFVDSIVIAPAERYIIEIYLEKSGTYEIQNNSPISNYTLWKIIVSDQVVKTSYLREFNTLRTNTDTISDIDSFRPYFDKTPDKEISLDIDMKWMMMNMMQLESHDGIEWEDEMVQMNKMHTSNMVDWNIIEKSTGKKNMNIDWEFKQWDIVKIRIRNEDTWGHPMQHPIHFHGQRFLVVDINGVSNDNLVWKDTVLVKKWEYVDIIMDMSNPGEWMTHCHIAEHLTAGMIMHFTVTQ